MANDRKYEPEAAPWGLEDELLKNFRLFVLEACGFNRYHTARTLGVSVRGLRHQLSRYRAMGEEIPDDTMRGPQLSQRALEYIINFVNMGTKGRSTFLKSWRKFLDG